MKKLFNAAGMQYGVRAAYRLIRRSKYYGSGGLMILLIVILWSVGGCKSKLFLRKDRHSASEVNKTRSDYREDSSERRVGMSMGRREDSLVSEYEVIIYPLDTFSFSPEKGYSGQAHRVLIKGKSLLNSSQMDSSNYIISKEVQKEAVIRSQLQSKLQDEYLVKEKEKPAVITFGWVVWVVMLLGGLVFVGRNLRRK